MFTRKNNLPIFIFPSSTISSQQSCIISDTSILSLSFLTLSLCSFNCLSKIASLFSISCINLSTSKHSVFTDNILVKQWKRNQFPNAGSYFMTSFDIENLFTNVPLTETVDILSKQTFS